MLNSWYKEDPFCKYRFEQKSAMTLFFLRFVASFAQGDDNTVIADDDTTSMIL